ncbi:hypothetical protein BZB76_1399 [Actinomadura pelletieri DSM 43383]|uniref:Uncharacterized protein n=1 Tax=Actinomadura pelletieri DSM 43383 TaxID=1120940 RepID=A0A495QRP3_9ACTN|nr:hypothetical protein [Actinomadura pelletieri]RKS76051.1 hypothetical protein BZB76_1399 [Actinomadura pelletieri DSM 43383]
MITLKAALIAASAVGTVAVGGGATWAMTGSTGTAAPQSHAEAPAAERKVQDTVPNGAPTCLPVKPGLPKTNLPDGAARKEVEKHLKQNPVTKDLPPTTLPKPDVPTGTLPQGELPKTDLPKTDLPKGDLASPGLPKTDVPGAKVPNGRTLPADLPTCAPSTGDLQKKAPAPRPSIDVPGVPGVPGKPGLPAVPKLDCAKLPPAVKAGGPVEKAVMLAKGLRLTSTVPGTADLRRYNICAVTQKWTGPAGRWITVETLKTPVGMTENQLRRALNLPQGGTPVTVHGSTAWMAPGNNGVLLFDPNGYSLLVNGSPVLAGDLKDVTTAVRKAQ